MSVASFPLPGCAATAATPGRGGWSRRHAVGRRPDLADLRHRRPRSQNRIAAMPGCSGSASIGWPGMWNRPRTRHPRDRPVPCDAAERKDAEGSEATNPENLICRAARLLKREFPELGLIGDVALDPYTDHGHDGVIRDGYVANDETLEVLARQAVNQAQAGIDIVAPSDMMDGRVGAIRARWTRTG